MKWLHLLSLPLVTALLPTTPQEALGAVVNPVLRKEEPSSKHVHRSSMQVSIDAAASFTPQLSNRHEVEKVTMNRSRHPTSLEFRSFSQLQMKAKEISGGTLYLTLIVVILSGITLGVVIPLGVNYYYAEVASPPWLRDLIEDMAPDRQRGAGRAGSERRGREEDIYARSAYESPRARRPRSSSSSRRRNRGLRAHERSPRPEVPHGPDILETSAGEADISTGDDDNKAAISFSRLPKIPHEHPPKQISSDEAGESPSSSAAARLQLLRREWLQATAKPTAPGPVPAGSRGHTAKRGSEESTTAAEDSTSSFSSLQRTGKRDGYRGRSPDEHTPTSSSAKRAVSFDSKVEVKNVEAEEVPKKRPESGSQRPQVQRQRSPKDLKDKRRAQVRSRSPKV